MAGKIEMNGMTYMTEAERQLLPQIAECPAAFLRAKNPSEEFMRATAFLNPRVLRFIENQSHMVRMIAAKLDCATEPLIRGITPEIRAALNKKNTRGVMGADLNRREIEEYENAMNVMKFGFAAEHLYPRKR